MASQNEIDSMFDNGHTGAQVPRGMLVQPIPTSPTEKGALGQVSRGVQIQPSIAKECEQSNVVHAQQSDSLIQTIHQHQQDHAFNYVTHDMRIKRDRSFTFCYIVSLLILVLTAFFLPVYNDTNETSKPLLAYIPLFNFIHSAFVPLSFSIVASMAVCSMWIYVLANYTKKIILTAVTLIPISCFLVSIGCVVYKRSLEKSDTIMYFSLLMFLLGITSAIVFYTKRKSLDNVSDIFQFSFQVLGQNPMLFFVSLLIFIAHIFMTLIWLSLFERLFLMGHFEKRIQHIEWIPDASSNYLALYFIFVYFWTSAILCNIQKATVAGVVGQWYFMSDPTASVTSDVSFMNLKMAMTTAFGTICFASLIQGTMQFIQWISSTIQKKFRNNTGLIHSLSKTLTKATQIFTHYVLIYSTLQNQNFTTSARKCTRMFHRNLILGLTTTFLSRLLIGLNGYCITLFISLTTFYLFEYTTLTTIMNGGIIGMGVGFIIPYTCVQLLTNTLFNTLDSTFVCYVIDMDTNKCHCETAHEVFGKVMY